MRTYALSVAVLCIISTIISQVSTHPSFGKRTKETKATCGYDACVAGDPSKINVHMVPHTHDDVGWLKTFDQYYYGSRTNIQRAGVQYVLDSVINELSKDPAKKFIWVETAFFWKWWLDQDQAMRDQVTELVNAGQFEFTGGAWSMNDEAAPHYHSIIDQFTWGFRILNDTFGECARPRVAWQIDPFGHSREMASISARLGFEGVFFARLDYQDKRRRLTDKAMEMIWHGSPDNLGSDADLFTHALYNHYSPPPGFCFDILCNDEPMIDNMASAAYNIPERVQQFVDFVHQQASNYRTNNIILTMGEDFTYSDAHVWYKNMDKIIKYVNALQADGGDINVFYSTPACYLKSVNEANQAFPEKSDDFFPYGSDFQTYWNGYFTSKPTTKYFERLGNNFLQVNKQLASLAGVSEQDEAAITTLREAMGVMQHHDAITGTMKDHVNSDYNYLLTNAFAASGVAAQASLNTLLGNASPTPVPVTSCLKLNVSECAVSESEDSFVVTLYNPLSRPVSHIVRLPVLGADYSVQAPDGSAVVTQLVPIHASVQGMPGRESDADTELVFRADNLPALGFRSYYVTRLARDKPSEARSKETRDTTMGNSRIELTLDNDGVTSSLVINNVTINLQQTFNYYVGAYASGSRSSGAYIFRPNGTDTVAVPIESHVVYKGPVVEEVHQTFAGGWISQVIRVYAQENHVEFEWMVGPIPDENEVGKEVISVFATDIASDAAFSTDSNGREMIGRIRDFRPTWDIDITETVSSNFYPVVSKISIKDDSSAVSVLVDRSQSGSSLRDGELELMVHRRLFHDDGFGVGEALNEVQYGVGLIARGKHWLVAGPADSATSPTLAAQERRLAQRKLLAAWTFISPTGGLGFAEWAAAYTMEYVGMTSGLPTNVQILTLEPWSDGTLLLRLEHIMEKSDDPVLSATATVNLQDAFAHLTINSATETTLGGNLPIEQLDRFTWASEGKEAEAGNKKEASLRAVDLTAITLEPMEIRTFIVDYTINP